MHEPDRLTHGDDSQACDRPDDHGKHDHTQLSRANDGAEPVRHFEMTAEQMHGA